MDFSVPDSNWDLSPGRPGDRLQRQHHRSARTRSSTPISTSSRWTSRAPRTTSPRPIRRTTPRPRYSPDGRWIVYGRSRRPDIDPDFTRLARYDRQSGEIPGLSEEWDNAPGGWTFTPDGKTMVFHARRSAAASTSTLCRSQEDRRAAAGRLGRHHGRSGGGAGRTAAIDLHPPFACSSRRLDAVPLSGGIGGSGGEPRALTTFNAERLAQIDWAPPARPRSKGPEATRSTCSWPFRRASTRSASGR